ncbi:4-hydroxyphenylacetate 3-monooxygenase oxygenase component [Amylibacter ulvae]|uniref:4-hydroxyphenylacetate 3-monooxygenase oxygenase component n=1 Tax=Paramylibacter ulvae TaxID=1651968 RepID=A0ABQ3CX35_9RHOB|nr:4-hydroxyphenylacetate 3-monooxygenase, oxygenase component [Amylibacter ulvae]GHA42674.1 4-hydroxyphenylacetate 3-monooxygenase oxygenase component [Amylibacter ulvae]
MTLGNGIRTGAQYIKGLQDDREVWTRGNRVADVTTEPGIMRGVNTLAGFLDRQHDEKYRDTVTYQDDDGTRCAMSFKMPKSKDDILAKGRAYYEWAKWSNGMFGRTPDYKNASVMSFASATSFLAQGTKGQADFAQNMTNFYDHVRTNDKVLTHTLVNPQISHAQAAAGKFSSEVALHVVKETDAGIIVNGARLLATLGPSADEIEVFPSTVLRADPANEPFAFAFAIPIATKGLKMICRDTYDHGKSHFDAPLASRFEEMDAVVIFDNVLVPWERVFMYGEPELCNQAFGATNAVVHMAHQVACGKLAKAEFLTGILVSILKATGRDRDLAMKGMVSEVMLMTETIRALLYQAEAEAHEDEYGNFIPLRSPLDTSRNLFPKYYPRMVEILQMMGSSSLMATPAEADFANDLTPDVLQYFQVANLEAKDRVALYRLAHDVAVSGFGNRQALYERFFFGPPHLMHAAYFDLYDKDRVTDRVDALLAQN